MAIEAILEGGDQRLIEFGIRGAAGGDVLDMGNLIIIGGEGADMVEKSLDFHDSFT
jgi:hypothetical protein